MNGIRHLVSSVSDLGAPQPGHAVEDSVAFRIRQPHALRMGDDARAFRIERPVFRKGMQMMRRIEFL
ncbi:hypothetical protein [Breoghania sp.]|uniref:hypothetical protein n=1 Tax=Breoghania sp. TaxID=2065378 RepID=UPI003204E446